MHLKKVLIDREKLSFFYLLHEIREIFRIFNLELLLWVFVLFHKEAIFDNLVALYIIFVLRTPE